MIDIGSGHYQIRIYASHLQKTSFLTKYGLYEWTVLTVELANTPSQFTRVMNRLLAFNTKLPKLVAVYCDDVLMDSSLTEEHLDHVWIMLDLLEKQDLKLKRSKCEQFHDEIELCGFQIKQVGVHPFGSTTQAVTESPWPRTMKDVLGLAGLMHHYHKFVQHYAHIVLLLYRMCKMSNKVLLGGCRRGPRREEVGMVHFVWNGEAEDVFEMLKDAICKAPVLPRPKEGGEYVLHSNASMYAVATVLSQQQQD
jgi:hypothetical protein